MPDWMVAPFEKATPDHIWEESSLVLLVARLGVAFLLGCVVAGLYRLTHGRGRTEGPGLLATLVLLTVLVAMVTLVIRDNIARAFSLVGALAIVRFRTVVEDTRDTAFVIFAVAVGMSVGAGYLAVPLVGIPIAGFAAFLFRPRGNGEPGNTGGYTLTVRVGAGNDPEAILRESFDKHLEKVRLTATSTARGGAAMDLTYAVALRRQRSPLPLVSELNALPGVQSVELREA
jgi:hypothetical protein